MNLVKFHLYGFQKPDFKIYFQPDDMYVKLKKNIQVFDMIYLCLHTKPMSTCTVVCNCCLLIFDDRFQLGMSNDSKKKKNNIV